MKNAQHLIYIKIIIWKREKDNKSLIYTCKHQKERKFGKLRLILICLSVIDIE